MQIAIHTVVSIRYKMQNSKGEVLEDILAGSPVEYLHGAENILLALESSLTGLSAGDQKQILVSEAAGFAGVNDDFAFEVVIDAVRPATEEEIRNGYPYEEMHPESCGPNCVC